MSLPIEEQKKLVLAEAEKLLKNRQVEGFYNRYIEFLDNYLLSQGINCKKIAFNHVSCNAQSLEDGKICTIDSIYELECRGMVFSFPENGHLLWLKGAVNPKNKEWFESIYPKLMVKEWFEESRNYLAVLATESEIYALMQSGVVKSTDPDFEENYIFEKSDEARRICSALPIDKVLEKAALVHHIDGSSGTYYSWESKSFISSYTDGSYDTGLFEVESSISKDYMLRNYIVKKGLYDMWCDVMNGVVPDFAAYDCLPEDKSVNYHYKHQIY